MSYTVETIENDLTTIRIEHDEDCVDPYTDYGMFGTLCHWHKRGFIGEDYSRNQDELQTLVKETVKTGGIAVPVYLYEHGGQTISAAPFSCPWDSGAVGVWLASREQIQKEYSCKRITKSIREEARALIVWQIKTLDDYLTGNCYGFIIEDKEGNHLDSCWGFLGDVKYCKNKAVSIAASFEKDLVTAHVEI